MVTDHESKFTNREPRVMAVGVPLKIMSNGTSGTTGKIGLRIVKLRLQSLSYVQRVAKILY
jgi:hypothetical protein